MTARSLQHSKQHHGKALINSFHFNGPNLEFHPNTQTLHYLGPKLCGKLSTADRSATYKLLAFSITLYVSYI